MNTEVEYAIGSFMRVRKLAGIYQIRDSWTVGGRKHHRRRYALSAVKGTGALLATTDAFADDMEPLPVGATAEEITLVSDPDSGESAPVIRAATAPQKPEAPAGHPEPAPEPEQPVTDAIRSRNATPGPGSGCMCGISTFCSVHDAPPAADEEPSELRDPFKPIRKLPKNPTYQELRGIVYNARFKGFESWGKNQLDRLKPGTPIAVAVTHETNGHAIWVILSEWADGVSRAMLEVFYPTAQGSSADAIEYAVLLALRQVPIRSNELEILFLESLM
jgi:hypothetical protein